MTLVLFAFGFICLATGAVSAICIIDRDKKRIWVLILLLVSCITLFINIKTQVSIEVQKAIANELQNLHKRLEK